MLQTPAPAAAEPPRRSSSGTLQTLLSMASQGATHVLPTSLSSLGSLSRRRASGPVPLLVTVRLLASDDDLYLTVPPSTPLEDFLQHCAAETGVSAASLAFEIEEASAAAPAPGLLASLRATLGGLSRERAKDTLIEWVNFMFVPEAVNREVRGRGVLSWTRRAVVPHLQPPPPPHVLQATVTLADGRASHRIELGRRVSLGRAMEAAARAAGTPPERLRAVVAQQRRPGAAQRLFWAVARLLFAALCAAAGWARWVALGPDAGGRTVRLRVEGAALSGCDGPANGSSASMEVRRDMTLGQLEELLQLRAGGDVGVELSGLLLRAAPGGGTDVGDGGNGVETLGKGRPGSG